MNHSEIAQLREETGVSVSEAAKALDLCEEYDIAKEYLRLRYTAIARYKVIEGKKIPFEIADYINLAKKNVNIN